HYSGPVNGTEQAQAIAVDPSGNVFVTGFASRAGGAVDCATIAYASTGTPLWTNRFNEAGNKDDVPQALAIGPYATVYVTGYSMGANGNHEYATVAYSSGGNAMWTN